MGSINFEMEEALRGDCSRVWTRAYLWIWVSSWNYPNYQDYLKSVRECIWPLNALNGKALLNRVYLDSQLSSLRICKPKTMSMINLIRRETDFHNRILQLLEGFKLKRIRDSHRATRSFTYRKIRLKASKLEVPSRRQIKFERKSWPIFMKFAKILKRCACLKQFPTFA